MWGDFVFRGDPGAPTVIPRGEGASPPGSIRRERPGRAQLRLARRFGPELGELAEARVTETNLVEQILRRVPFPKIGSYATAISGKRTEGGGGLLLGSPQAGITAPSIFWQLGQHAPGRNCTGFTVPGLGPWTGIGWCGGHAWSLVAGNAGEQVDNYVERLHPDDPRRYRYRDRWREMEVHTETFEVNRCVPPICEEPQPPRTETVELEHTVHGPVVARDEERGIAISQRRIQEGRWARSIETVVGWNEARSLREFETATRKATGTYNLFYADRDGHALYRFTGLQPVRDRGIDRRLPSPGNGRREWRGRLGFRQMPHAVNPRSGVLVSNQGIESDPIGWWPNASGVPIGQASRVGGNRRLLARSGLDPQRLQEINPLLLERRDHITAVFARNLVRALRDTGNARLREALDLLREWKRDRFARVDRDGDGRYDHPAMTIFGADNFNLPAEDYPRHLWTDLLDRVFADELGERTEPGEQGTFEAPGTYLGQLSRLKLALDGRRSGIRLARSYPDDIDTKRREGAGRVIRESLAETLARLEAEFGTPEMRQWTRPVVETEFTALGAAAPPPITGFDHGTYSQIVDPRATDGRYILPPGNGSADSAAQTAAAQAGQFPEHFADQRELYEDYNFIQMPRRASQYTANPESVTELDYPDG